MKNDDRSCIDVGLRYVNNDACYPSLIVVGQVISALQSGKYDVNKVAVFYTQTGGGCRATNYIGLIRRALAKAGYPQVPVISISTSGIEKNPGFSFTPRLIVKVMHALCYGDLYQKLLYRVRPYEKEKGSANNLPQLSTTIPLANFHKRSHGDKHKSKATRQEQQRIKNDLEHSLRCT